MRTAQTRFTRTRNGKVVHLSTCRTLANAKTQWPWEWAENAPIDRVAWVCLQFEITRCNVCLPTWREAAS